ncbi:MAG: hypothetical protein ACTTHG_01720 [Treponemataceae bacterium]
MKNFFAFLPKKIKIFAITVIAFDLFLAVFVIAFLCASEALSSHQNKLNFTELTIAEEELINNVQNFRLELYCVGSQKKSLEMIEEKFHQIEKIYDTHSISLQIQLVAENLLTIEKFNHILNRDSKSKLLEPLIMNQYKKNKDWFKNHQNQEYNQWLYCTAGDILSLSLSFLPLSTFMSEGVNVKKYYEKALSIDKDFCFCLANLAQWHQYAPVIAGGSKENAKKLMTRAQNSAHTPFEKCYVSIFMSQIEFENGNNETCIKLLNAAASIKPVTNDFYLSKSYVQDKNFYVDFIRNLNFKGYSIYYYTVNKEQVEKTTKLLYNGE